MPASPQAQSGGGSTTGTAGEDNQLPARPERSEVPADAVDTDGDGYDFPVIPDTTVNPDAPCRMIPEVHLPQLEPNADCAGSDDLVIGWVSDCRRCAHLITVVVGNRGIQPVAAAISINDDPAFAIQLGTLAPLSWSAAVTSSAIWGAASLEVHPADDVPLCNIAEAKVQLDFIECLPK